VYVTTSLVTNSGALSYKIFSRVFFSGKQTLLSERKQVV
jgi:hypothetical protein